MLPLPTPCPLPPLWYQIYIYDIGFTEFKGGMRKINNSFKIPRNPPNIRISHSLKFSIKPNIRIFIFSGI